jgi:predicted peptidase
LLTSVSSVILALSASGILAVSASGRKHATGFLDRQITMNGTRYKYQVFVPEDWTPRKIWPVILFLHGAGERGDDGLLQTEVGIGTAIRRYRSRFPAIVIFPQCRNDKSWSGLLGPCQDVEDMVLKTLEETTKEFCGDPKRTYLTGISMGGYGSFRLAARHPHKFAAFVPVCGGIRFPDPARPETSEDNQAYTNAADKIGPVPVWIFHGEEDPIIPVAESRRMFAAMKAGGGEALYTEYRGVGHDSWVNAYAKPDLMPWLLSKRLP